MTESTPLSVSVQSAIHGVLVYSESARWEIGRSVLLSLNEEMGGSLEEHHNPDPGRFSSFRRGREPAQDTFGFG